MFLCFLIAGKWFTHPGKIFPRLCLFHLGHVPSLVGCEQKWSMPITGWGHQAGVTFPLSPLPLATWMEETQQRIQGPQRCQNKPKKKSKKFGQSISTTGKAAPPLNHLFQIQCSMRLLAILKFGSLLAMAANCTLTDTTYHLTFKKSFWEPFVMSSKAK